MEIGKLHDIFLSSKGLTTDSRAVQGGEMFLAVKGENFDGNDYAEKALEAGALCAVVDEGSRYAGSDDRIIAVPDTLQALKDLARYHREHSLVGGRRLTVIGLTGTNGKTTTKELIRAVLSTKYRVTATEGNLNNDIGVPLSLLKIDGKTQVAVIEMGANHPDDIEKLVAVAEPDYGLITNVGRAHLLGFGSFEGVKKAKGALYDYVRPHGGAVFVNADDTVLMDMCSQRTGLQIIPYGVKYSGSIVLPSDEGHPFLRMAVSGEADDETLLGVNTKLVGAYNADNVMAALAVGAHFGVRLEDAVAAVEQYQPIGNRSQMVQTSSNHIIMDAYNANPTSMSAALDNFADVQSEKKMALLGDMRELGEESMAEHIAIARKAMAMGLGGLCFVGEEFGKALESTGKQGNVRHFADSEVLAAYLQASKPKGWTILVKGSRGIQMEKVLPEL